ncbi:MAG TPA: PPOX class F420-dependent oxidoreductase [Chloroflexota bacterium]|jgi:PPOX class probable F420-dependent enzyme
MPRADRLSPRGVQLLQEQHLAVLSTIMPDGSPQATPVWVDVEPDGSHVLVNTVEGHLKQRNVARDPRVAVTVVDGQNHFRTVVVRGIVVEQRGHEQGAHDHINFLTKKYTGRERYALRKGERRVLLRIKPTHVVETGVADEARWRAGTSGETGGGPNG